MKQTVRREARAVWGEGIEAMGTLLRKKPKYFPKFLWIVLLMPVFKTKAVKLLYKHL